MKKLIAQLRHKKAQRKTHMFGSVKLSRRKHGVIYWTKPSRLSLIFSALSIIFIAIALLSASAPIVPMIWYRLHPGTSDALAQVLSRPAVTFGDLLAAAGDRELDSYQPPIDLSLPKKNLIRIPKIGVDTEILEEEAETYENALQRGVWRVPNFGDPFERRYPTILVAHRFGYLNWSNSFRRQNSFFNLPKLEPGDQIELIWEQRKYVFEIYGGDESELMRDYSADLVLYTCRFLESPVRIFRYAKLMKVSL